MKTLFCILCMLTVCLSEVSTCEGQANAVQNQQEQEQSAPQPLMTAPTAEGPELAAELPDDEEATGEVQELTSAQFAKKVANYTENPRRYIGRRPCIVDFYATWCGPCKKLAPIMEKLAEKYKGKVSFYKVDVDKAEDLSRGYGIQSIPTVFFCANGEIRSMVGLMPETVLEEIISEMLAAPMK